METTTLMLTPALTIPVDDTRPGLPGPLEVLGRRVKRAITGRFNKLATHVAIGRAAAVLDAVGFDWQTFSSPEDIIAKANAVMVIAAHPLVVNHGLPLQWLVGSAATPLGDAELKAIERAIELAEQLGEDWRKWPETVTPGHVVAHELPRLIAKSEAPAPAEPQQKRPSRGQRKALRRQKALARAQAAKPTVAAVPVPTQPQTHESERVVFTPGLVIDKGDVPHVVCTGRRGQCLRLTPVSDAQVGSIGAIKRKLGLRRWDEITEAHLASISFCGECADHILAGGHQAIGEAIKAIAAKIVACETRQAEELAAREAERAYSEYSRLNARLAASEARARSERARQRARLAANGGASGNPSNARPAAYLAKKAAKAEASRDAMHKGPSGGGGKKK